MHFPFPSLPTTPPEESKPNKVVKTTWGCAFIYSTPSILFLNQIWKSPAEAKQVPDPALGENCSVVRLPVISTAFWSTGNISWPDK